MRNYRPILGLVKNPVNPAKSLNRVKISEIKIKQKSSKISGYLYQKN
jgi:hypothetical protein